MKTYILFGLFSLLSFRTAAQDKFKHEWDTKYLEHGIQFTSKSAAPVPFSNTGEPSAIMTVDASQIDPSSKSDLAAIVKDEINGIRSELRIEEYLEKDYKPDSNIVSYFDDINSVKLAVIKYRTTGSVKSERVMPRSVRQILIIKDSKLYVSSLIVLFAGDQDNMRSDQMTFIRKLAGR